MQVYCLKCGIEFKKGISDIKRSKNHFCSRSCAASYNNTGVTRNRKTKTCPVCNDAYFGQKKTCSKLCAKKLRVSTISQNLNQRKADSILLIPKNTKICKECNQVFAPKKKTQTFCSYSCSSKHQHVINKDKREENYLLYILNENKTKTKSDCKNHRSFKENRYIKIRANAQQIYKYYYKNSVCENCGYDKHIEVCHKKSISSFSDDTLISEINSPDNLIGLCPNCHWEFDNKLLLILHN